MTEEEIEKEAKEYSQGNFYSEQGFLYGYERGSAESRKEVRLYETTYINRLHHIEKENEELKGQMELLQQVYTITVDKFVIREQELEAQIEELQLNLRTRNDLVEELTMQIEKMKNFYNCSHSSRALCPNGHKCNGCKEWEMSE